MKCLISKRSIVQVRGDSRGNGRLVTYTAHFYNLPIAVSRNTNHVVDNDAAFSCVIFRRVPVEILLGPYLTQLDVCIDIKSCCRERNSSSGERKPFARMNCTQHLPRVCNSALILAAFAVQKRTGERHVSNKTVH